jgi:hypothetical protein
MTIAKRTVPGVKGERVENCTYNCEHGYICKENVGNLCKPTSSASQRWWLRVWSFPASWKTPVRIKSDSDVRGPRQLALLSKPKVARVPMLSENIKGLGADRIAVSSRGPTDNSLPSE